ncbi:DUF402 domain-containing protein [Streptomyces ipomoeae]|jgi:hypothetical protein|uniref:DUF402 domain-containing protein n=2 Tax=Streptomyces ipomoeae TaxID=103232 RepID=L1KYN5_9ACTN|nr:DUF402 domain-containing protein [Streptomyces ipomoeae]EKX65453.1 hypothetical protein STRIP9103_01797 [Streptomyces ipomoeae 91-03]MDX2696327.1 DUF402 domain-containing protein [Streptomyces ipomoeae]MDX2823961.1 DUF402 domain-containing protein [Streptomyces ipomoeae]MDX2843839.1 DUF402 domain-containing protein [Streptomyces ipomoeae]MDX2876718.1 DUF402 domain-containing protein [Streptomyces ipomoeae]
MSANSADPTAGSTADDPGLDVVLLKAGRTKIRYPARLLSDDGTRVAVRAAWASPGVRDFGFVRFEPGDVFTEYYWRDRWYSVKEVRDGQGGLKGWYCDITRPATLSGGELVVEDLDLDLWRSADGTAVLRLDEDEFEESGLRATDPTAAEAALAALDELELLAREGDFTALLS